MNRNDFLSTLVAVAYLEKYFREDDTLQDLIKSQVPGLVLNDLKFHVMKEFDLPPTNINIFLLRHMPAIFPSLDMEDVLPHYGYDTYRPGSLRMEDTIKCSFPAFTLDGKRTVVPFGKGRQVFLFGSATCRDLELNMGMWKMWQGLHGHLYKFYFVYGKEAHPVDKWRLDSQNKEQLQNVTTPAHISDRVATANAFCTINRLEKENVIVDGLNDLLFEVFSAFPARLVVIENGIVRLIVPITCSDTRMFEQVDNLFKGVPFFNILARSSLLDNLPLPKKEPLASEVTSTGVKMAQEAFPSSLEKFLKNYN